MIYTWYFMRYTCLLSDKCVFCDIYLMFEAEHCAHIDSCLSAHLLCLRNQEKWLRNEYFIIYTCFLSYIYISCHISWMFEVKDYLRIDGRLSAHLFCLWDQDKWLRNEWDMCKIVFWLYLTHFSTIWGDLRLVGKPTCRAVIFKILERSEPVRTGPDQSFWLPWL